MRTLALAAAGPDLDKRESMAITTTRPRDGLGPAMNGTRRAPAMLPNFLIIGAMKAGTTSLYHYLEAHPQVFMPAIKELDFFAAEFNWSRGWEWYGRQFAAAGPGAVALGEASTSYTKYPRYRGVPERIARHLPGARLIYVIRHPIERIRSQYRHNVAFGKERLPIDEAVLQNPSYIDYSRYALQIERYLEHFPREQLLVITSDDLRHRREATVRRVYEFVGVDAERAAATLDQEFFRTEERLAYPPLVGAVRRSLRRIWPGSVGLAGYVPKPVKRWLGRPIEPDSVTSAAIPRDTLERLEEMLRDDVRRLRDHLGRDFDGWGIA